MTGAPTPRQVLYAIVAGGFGAVALVLTIGAAMAGITPAWWTVTMSASLVAAAIFCGINWRRTGLVLGVGIGLFVISMAGALIVA